MKRVFIFCTILLLSTVAFAQSDCNATHCGSLPLMNFSNENGGVTDLVLYYDSDCNLWFRTRFSPSEGTGPDPNHYQVEPGEHHFYLRDIMGSWADYRGAGTFIIDWASYDCVPDVRAAGIYRNESGPFCSPVYYNVDQPQWYEPGCYTFIVSYQQGSFFTVYNEDDSSIQTLSVMGVLHLVLPGETLRIEALWEAYFVSVCIGEEPPGPSWPGLDLDLPLYIEGLTIAEDGDAHRIINLK